MKKRNINRRYFLQGAGSVLIGLPLLEESFIGKALAAEASIPLRFITMTFGLGIDRVLQAEKERGPLESLYKGDIASKTCFFSELKNGHLASNDTSHFHLGAAQVSGKKQSATAGRSGGASVEQVCLKHFHPNGVPSISKVASVSAGIWSRTGRITQYCRQWNEDGSPGPIPLRRPSKVFDAIFGSVMPSGGPTQSVVDQAVNGSILDSVLAQYNSLTGASSYLGQESKNKIHEHLDKIRASEAQLRQSDQVITDIEQQEIPSKGAFADPANFSFYDAASGAQDAGAPRVDWLVAQNVFRLIGDLYVLGLKSDALRFGSLIFNGAGEHIRFSGTYTAPTAPLGSLNFTEEFSGISPHHGIFHRYQRDKIRVYQHYSISQLAYCLQEMDKVIEPNGLTLLDNTCVVMATEYGENHNSDGVFGAVVGGNGKFKPGYYNSPFELNDFYKNILDAYQVRHTITGKIIPNFVVA